MDDKVKFFFWLASVICFGLAAVGDLWRFGARTRRGLVPQLALVPLGLFLFVFPFVWDQGELAF
ncbi:MAG TPA: hypothetical protein VHE80_09910 [Acidimicrobiales bacterium]|nr:hypothetical protein [Acidimicrobiales bacterium]